MDKLIELTKDVWTFGCKGDLIRVSAERIDALEAAAKKLGESVYVEVKEGVSAAERAAAAVEADVVAAVKDEAPKVEAVVEDVAAAVKKGKK